MNKTGRYTSFTLGAIAAALLAATSTEAQSPDESVLTAEQRDAVKLRIAACDDLPSQQRPACVQGARRDYALMEQSLTRAQKATLERENVHYQEAIAECAKLDYPMERSFCIDEAANEQEVGGSR